MEDVSVNIKKENNGIKGDQPIGEDKPPFNFQEYSKLMEIVSLEEDNIELKCNNNQYKKIKVKDYLDKMAQFNNNDLNKNICDLHKEKFSVFCFECKKHLCQECLKLGEHSYHYKINLIEITPNEQKLTKIKNKIQNNKLKLKELT